jgi:hypothetical protein
MTGDEPTTQPPSPLPPPEQGWSPAAAPPPQPVLGAPVYPPPGPGSAYPSPPAERPRRALLRPTAAVLLFAAAIATLFGTFLDLFAGRILFRGEERVALVISAWDASATERGAAAEAGGVPANGAPLVVAAAILLVAAVVGVLAAAAPGAPRIVRASGLLAPVATAFLIGTVWTVGMEVANWVGSFRPVETPATAGSVRAEVNVGNGFWLLLGGATAAVAATVVVWWAGLAGRVRSRREEPETPRYGFPVVVRLPDTSAEPGD